MDIKKLIGFLSFIIFKGSLLGQCDVELNKCVVNLKSKTIYLFVKNLLPNEPQKEKIFLYEGYFYSFSSCVSPGLGDVILGIQETNGKLIKNNIVSNSEIKNHFEWKCKETGFYHLIYWLHEGSGCIAVNVSIYSTQKFD